jgi:hypothetical protein
VFTATDADEANQLTATYTTKGGLVYMGDPSFTQLAIGSTAGHALKVSASGVPEWGQLTSVALATDSVTSAQIAADAVDSSEIKNNAVVTAKITDANVTNAKLNNGASGDIPLVTVSTSDPTGGKNGDVWVKVV